MSDAKSLPRITIITPSFNQAPFLEETIRSVLDQGYPNLQYGVIDGGSTDGSADIIQRYRDRLDFAVIEKDNGQTEAINKGLKRADGDIVGWLCSDDTLLPGSLNTLAKHFAQHPGDDWLAGAVRVIDIKGNPTGKVRPSGTFTLPGVLLRSHERPFNLPQPGVFWRRSLHDELGLLDESLHYCMDFEFWLRLIESGRRPTLIDAELSTYRLHETSKSCAMPMGFTKEHVRIETHYARTLPLLQRTQVLRRMGYMHRASVLASTGGKPWGAVARRPWWLLSQQVRWALRRGVRDAA
jgi:glycosyltransferase involved in cell wall biosynthesis